MGVLHLDQFEVPFPIGAFLIQRGGAEADFHPRRLAAVVHAGGLHVSEVFVSCDGAFAKGAIGNGPQERCFAARLYSGFDEVTHRTEYPIIDGSAAD